jgi:hypothetical protein
VRLKVKRAFVLADWMKSASRCDSEEEFLLLLRAEQTRVEELSESQMDQIIKRDESRLERFQTCTWAFRTVGLGDCHVYSGMGKRSWAVGRASEVSTAFTRLEPSSSRIWKMKLFAPVFSHLPLILLQIDKEFTIDDGSHRAIAMYLAGIRDAQAYIGVP